MTILSSKDDLFNLNLIRSYVDKELNPRFVERHWLKQQVEEKLAEPDCRFVLLTAEPGAGKSAFMAWLAHEHPNWCRYFIRRNQRTPLGDVGSYSFLLQVGFQLAATYPNLFKQEHIKIAVEQRIGIATNSEIVGVEIEKMFASPFYEKVIQIQQQVTQSKDTNITGVRIGEFYATERDLPLENLQFMALFDPAKAMMKQVQAAMDQPQQQIVVLVDALDELSYQDSELSLLKWLTNCPELPANLRFVLTCRPDDDLLRTFRGNQQGRIREISVAEEDPDVEKDLTRYTRFLIETPEVNQALIEMHQNLDGFTNQAVKKANGNFGYLGAIGRAVDEAVRQEDPNFLKTALSLSQLPNDLQNLYAFFLEKVKNAVDEQAIRVIDPKTGKKYFLEVWTEIYQPILSLLCVAREPLTLKQIQKLGDIPGDWQHLIAAINRLRQFLDKVEDCYRLYHSTLPEFFTSPETQADYSYCYVDAIRQHQLIVTYYLNQYTDKWLDCDEYGLKFVVQHTVSAEFGSSEIDAILSKIFTDSFRAARLDSSEWHESFIQDIWAVSKLSPKLIANFCLKTVSYATFESESINSMRDIIVGILWILVDLRRRVGKLSQINSHFDKVIDAISVALDASPDDAATQLEALLKDFEDERLQSLIVFAVSSTRSFCAGQILHKLFNSDSAEISSIAIGEHVRQSLYWSMSRMNDPNDSGNFELFSEDEDSAVFLNKSAFFDGTMITFTTGSAFKELQKEFLLGGEMDMDEYLQRLEELSDEPLPTDENDVDSSFKI